VQPEQVRGAIASLSMLSPVNNGRDGKHNFPDTSTPENLDIPQV
jgi:integrase/recombinase XerD